MGTVATVPSLRPSSRRSLRPTWVAKIFGPTFDTTCVSGSTRPLTTASPNPNAASITIRSVAPVEGSQVNITPARSAATISWTTTAMTGSSRIPRLARYATARSPYSDCQHRTTASTTASAPTTLATVRCIPANEAPAVSSAVADDRTATGTSLPRRP